jgi:hypothetical protein
MAGSDLTDAIDRVSAEAINQLTEVTPRHMRCHIGKCPAVFSAQDGKIVIIGKKATDKILNEIGDKIGDDEFCVVVDRELIKDL